MRPLVVSNNARVQILVNGEVVKQQKKPHVQPSEMIKLKLTPKIFKDIEITPDSKVEVTLQDEP